MITFARALSKVHVEAEGRTEAKKVTRDSCLRCSQQVRKAGCVVGQH